MDPSARGLAAKALGQFSALKPGLRAITTRTGALGGIGTVDGTNFTITDGVVTSATYRWAHQAPADRSVSDPHFIYAGWHLSAEEKSGENAITVKPYIEYSGVSYPLFCNGSQTATIGVDGTATFNGCAIEIPAGATFYERVYVSVSSGGKWPLGARCRSIVSEGSNIATTGADVASGTGVIVSSNEYGFQASAIVGYSSQPYSACIGILGDSIEAGTGDSTGGDANGNVGWFERGLTNAKPWIRSTRGFAQARYFNTASAGGSGHWRRMVTFAPYVTHVMVGLAHNDLFQSDSPTFATMQARLQAVWAAFTARGIKVYQRTCPPRTLSTDSWATAVNQTPEYPTQEAVRVQFNNWIRTLPAPLSGYLDLADVMETSRNSGIWIPTATADGVHPTSAYHALGAAIVNPAMFS